MSKRNLSEPLLAAIDSIMSQMHTCLPGKVERYEFSTQRADVKPLLRRHYLDGEVQGMPVIADVPVVWPRSGGASLTMPVKQGDGVLLVFADRSIDNWLAEGGEVTPDDRRKHALSDCIAIPGLYSFADTSPQDNNDDVLLQYAGSSVRLTGGGDIEAVTDGNIAAEAAGDITANAEGDITATSKGDTTINCENATVNANAEATVTAPSSVTVDTPAATFTGTVTCAGLSFSAPLPSGSYIETDTGTLELENIGVNVTGADVVADGISLKTHTHPGDSGGTTGQPQ